MKKMAIATLAVFMLSAGLFGQTWTVETQMEDIPGVQEAFFIDANTGWVILEDNRVDKTTDGGANWVTVHEDDPDGVDWEDIEFYDADTGYVAAYDGFIFKTVDGGLNWVNVGDTANYTDDYNGLSVVDANTVYFAGKDTLVTKTTDGGATFTYQLPPDNAGDRELDGGIAFCDANVGVVISDYSGGLTWYTTDGGDNWTFREIASIFPLGSISSKLYDVAAGGTGTIAIAAYHNIIFVSQDGGATYVQSGDYSLATEYYKDVEVVDANTIIGGGKYIVGTTDGGASWDTLAVGTSERPYSINYLDATTGYIFCGANQWFKTTDGTSFTAISGWPDLRFLNIEAFGTNSMLATSWGDGDMTESSDGGASWTHPLNLKTNSQVDVWEIEFFDDTHGLIAGDGGYLWMTADGGATWTAVDNPMKDEGDHILATAYIDANTILIGGDSYRAVKSVDGGANWTELGTNGTDDIQDFYVVNDTMVIAIANDGQILVSTAEVDSFYVTYVAGEGQDMNAMDFANGIGIIVSDNKLVYRLDATAMDTLVLVYTASTGDDLLGAKFINDYTVAVVGDAGMIITSNDAGLTWTEEAASPTTVDLYDVEYVGGKLWACGDDGVIISGDYTDISLYSDLYINEFLASNDFAAADENGDYDDYIEIYNAGTTPVDIGGLFVTDDLSDPTGYQIADTNSTATTIAAGGFLKLWADKESEEGILHVELKLSSDGEQVGLFQIIGDKAGFIDSLTFTDVITDTSFGRYPDGSDNWVNMDPTPGATNTEEIIVGIRDNISGIPSEFAVHQNYPNPFNPTTEIHFDLPANSNVNIVIYNILGEAVRTLVDSDFTPGYYNAFWDATNDYGVSVSSGIYFYSVKTNSNTITKRMVYIK